MLYFKLGPVSIPVHPVATHFPNALLPASALFLFLYIAGTILNLPIAPSFETTAFYCLVLALLATPAAYWAGYYDWKNKYRGAKAPIFTMKVKYGVIMLVLGVLAVALHLAVPQTASMATIWFWIYAVMILAQVGLAGLLGHLGGKLVYLH